MAQVPYALTVMNPGAQDQSSYKRHKNPYIHDCSLLNLSLFRAEKSENHSEDHHEVTRIKTSFRKNQHETWQKPGE